MGTTATPPAQTLARQLVRQARRLEVRAAKQLEQAMTLRQAARRLVATEQLPPRSLSPSHALKIAAGRANDDLARACVDSEMTMGQVVAKVQAELGLSRLPISGISQARRGLRPIRRDVAEAIERLTGFRATSPNWPGGIRDP